MSTISKYWYQDENTNSSVRAKMTARTLHFPDAKTCIDSVGEVFSFSFHSKKGLNGFYPLMIKDIQEQDKPAMTKEVVFAIKYHTLQVATPNPDYPNEKSYATLVPIPYSPETPDYDFLIQHQKDEEGYLLDLYNQGLVKPMNDMVRGEYGPEKEGIHQHIIHAIGDIKVKLPTKMKGFSLEDLLAKVKPDHSFIALRVLGGWKMETNPDILTLSPDRVWSCRIGASFTLYPWTVQTMRRPSTSTSSVIDRKRKVVESTIPPVEPVSA